MPVVATAPTHIAAATKEVEEVSAAVIALVGRGTPIVAALANVIVRRTDAEARSRKKDTVAVRSGYFIASYTVLSNPFPGAFVY